VLSGRQVSMHTLPITCTADRVLLDYSIWKEGQRKREENWIKRPIVSLLYHKQTQDWWQLAIIYSKYSTISLPKTPPDQTLACKEAIMARSQEQATTTLAIMEWQPTVLPLFLCWRDKQISGDKIYTGFALGFVFILPRSRLNSGAFQQD